jgi:glutamate/tyrosine decarboxylase-like PLP-dependent enzyme
LFGFEGPNAGGVSQPGGSASNATSIVIARNTLFPETKNNGNGNHKFVLFTSVQGHYSIEKAAQMCGFGSHSVWHVPCDQEGRMDTFKLVDMIRKSRKSGCTPLYVNATAGTTVLGQFDPLNRIADICAQENLWMHVDASWGGAMIFSEKHRNKLSGASRANSLTFTPHKMLGVPVTCSFLLGRDLEDFWRANTLPAGYLYHESAAKSSEMWDLGDLTLQCGRKGDSLKLALGWIYYGSDGYGSYVDLGYENALELTSLVVRAEDLILVSQNPPSCLQVCMYYASGGVAALASTPHDIVSERTRKISDRLLSYGFMVDYAPGSYGNFLRVVVNGETKEDTLTSLIRAISEIGVSLK